MRCERCGQREATVHQTVVTNGQKQESHLCVECAREVGAFPDFSFPTLSVQQLLSSFRGQTLPGAGSSPALKPEPTCRHCGMTYSQFAQSGMLGCPRCYQELEQQLMPLIKRIQGTTTHSGKVPKRTGGLARKRRDLKLLKAQLQRAVESERYEEAAKLRDQIRALEAEIAAGGGSGGVE
ncbi:MAG: UvrB/UvrC motif-containing protein [Symbiobacteriaceae bacterium]